MNSSALNIGQTRAGNVCIVTLSGRIDSTNANDVMTDLTSAAFRALLVATDEAERQAARFALCSLAGHVRELFEMGGLLEVFAIHNSREEALKQLG
jgi:anti-anti-sigma regulatory factor